jgi:hypothetical protein
VWRRLSALVVKRTRSPSRPRQARRAHRHGGRRPRRRRRHHAGAKAIVWAIEAAAGPRPLPLGRRRHRRRPPGGGGPSRPGAHRKPGLIFIHGTGSHTLGGFGQLPGSQSWRSW